MPKASVFISHSSNDKVFATSVAAELRETNFTPWIDKERIYVGADILEELGKGLTAMDLFVLIVSREAVELGWVTKEIGYAAYREITEKRVLILPFIIDETKIIDLPWHLHNRNIVTIRPDNSGLKIVVESVRHSLEQREVPNQKRAAALSFKPVPEVDALLKGRELGDWDAAEESALQVLAQTDGYGRNLLFQALLTYRDAGKQETD